MASPEIWGPHIWRTIHYISLGYPETPSLNDKQIYKNFIISLKDVLPCAMCRKHFNELLIKHPLTEQVLSSKTNLIKWCIDAHNIVNIQNNKKVFSYEEAINSIMSSKPCDHDNDNSFFYLLIIGLLIYCYMKYNLK